MGDLTTTATQIEDLLGQTENSMENLSKFKTALAAAPSEMKTDTTLEFGAMQENFTALEGREVAVKSQLDDMKTRLNELSANYSSGKIKKDDAKSEFTNFASSLSQIQESIKNFASDYGQVQDDFGKMRAAFNMKMEEREAEKLAAPTKK